MSVSDYDLTPANNTTISGTNINEGCSPAGMNNAVRQMMADIKAWVPKFNTVASLLDDTDYTYSIVSEGDHIHAGGFIYEVVDEFGDYHLATAGGVKLNVLPSFGMYSVAAFGSVTEGADISAVATTALEAVFAARNGLLVFPAGRYLLNSLVDAHYPSSGSGYPVHMVSIDGTGCVLEAPASNTDGGIKITTYNNFQQLHLSNLEIQSSALIGANGDPTNGIGLHVYSSLRPGDAGWGTTAARQLTLKNVHVVSSRPSANGRWDTGIKIDGFWFPLLEGVWANTRHPGNDDDLLYESGDGIALWNCYSPELVACYSVGRFTHNIRIDENEGDVVGKEMPYEDFQLTGCYAVGGKDAAAVRMTSAALKVAGTKEPGGRISGGHYNGHRRAISIENRRQFTIDGALLYTTIGAGRVDYASAAFVYLNDCFDALVTGLNIPEGGHYTSDADCTRHVQLTGDTDYITVEGNLFGAKGIAIANTSTGTHNTINGNTYESSSDSPTNRIVNGGGSGQLLGADVQATITPTLEFGGGSTGVTYSTQDGGYTQAGRLVVFWIDIRLTSKGTDTGTAVIVAGLPAPITAADFAANVSYSSSNTQAPSGGLLNSSGEIQLFFDTAAGNRSNTVDDADFANTSTIRISGSYIAAE